MRYARFHFLQEKGKQGSSVVRNLTFHTLGKVKNFQHMCFSKRLFPPFALTLWSNRNLNAAATRRIAYKAPKCPSFDSNDQNHQIFERFALWRANLCSNASLCVPRRRKTKRAAILEKSKEAPKIPLLFCCNALRSVHAHFSRPWPARNTRTHLQRCSRQQTAQAATVSPVMVSQLADGLTFRKA